MKNQKNLKILAECAIMVGLAAVLSEIKFFNLPFGGSVTLFSMVPVILIALRHGFGWGMVCAFVYSGTQLLFGLGNLAWVPTVPGKIFCVLFDYTFAFGCLGAAGVFKKPIDKSADRRRVIGLISAAVVLVCALRYISHNISAAVVWYGLFAEPGENLARYIIYTALSYNAAYMVPETIITLVAAPAVTTALSAVGKKKNPAGG